MKIFGEFCDICNESQSSPFRRPAAGRPIPFFNISTALDRGSYHVHLNNSVTPLDETQHQTNQGRGKAGVCSSNTHIFVLRSLAQSLLSVPPLTFPCVCLRVMPKYNTCIIFPIPCSYGFPNLHDLGHKRSRPFFDIMKVNEDIGSNRTKKKKKHRIGYDKYHINTV